MTHLDTSFVIDLLRGRARGAGGAARAIHASREQHRVRARLDAVTVVYPDDRFAPRFGATLAAILRTGRSLATMDLLIATSALLEGAPLATANRRHFEVVPDLVVIGYRAHVRDT